MADYWLTFRIEQVTVGDRSSSTRRDALYDAVDNLSTVWWVEPTSFILFTSTLGIAAIATKCKAAISASHDIVLIRKVNAQDARVMGKVDNLALLQKYMPYCVKV